MEIDVDLLEKWCELLSKSTKYLDVEVLRELIHTCHKHQNVCIENEKLVDVSNNLLSHMNYGFSITENQTLCSSAFFAILSLMPDAKKYKYLDEILITLIEFNRCLSNIQTQLPDHSTYQSEIYVACLINSIYQINLLSPASTVEPLLTLKKQIINITYQITVRFCIRYTHCTFIHFRNLHAIVKKTDEWGKMSEIIGNGHVNILYVVFNNWGNPISGVRDFNLKILSSYFSMLKNEDCNLLHDLSSKIMLLSWNRAKYCTISALVPFFNFDNVNTTILDGLDYSLCHSSLVSSGCDLYKMILNKTNSVDDWILIFNERFENILSETTKEKKKNMINYWLPMTLKKYPEIYDILISYFIENETRRKNTYAVLSLVKLGRKLGFILNSWNDVSEDMNTVKSIVIEGVTHIDEDVRTQAIQIICTSHKNTCPTDEEIELFKSFYVENINCDSTPFRQNNLNCFTLFLIRFRDYCISKISTNDKLNISSTISEFFKWLHQFLIYNLKSECNYQRKILTLNMHNVVLRYLNGGYETKRSLCRKGNFRNQGVKVRQYLSEENAWSFDSDETVDALIKCILNPASDIGENAANILMEYYKDNSYFINKLPELFLQGIDMSNSKLFYKNENGTLLLKIVAHFSNSFSYEQLKLCEFIAPANSLVEFYYKICIEQFDYVKIDILKSIHQNKPLHGMMSALNTIINCTDEPLPIDFLKDILQFITLITDYFIDILTFGAETKEFPPSFAQMGESVELLVNSSSMKCEQSKHFEKLSNAHQSVLNNIWLNLKICCELSLTLIIKSTQIIDDGKLIEKCLQISIDVLTKCRHKGAIESAGVLLGHSVKHITSQKRSTFKNLIADILIGFLKQSTSNDISGSSVTRRSAGLTILVHRIVSNDLSDDKHLFYLTMKFLIGYLLEKEVNYDSIDSNQRDVPIARALHLLCRTVSESSLSNHTILFAPNLSAVCFNYLSSDEWQIRNAALQLYGALVPKIIGQKPSHNAEITSESPVTIDELFVHIPSLCRTVNDNLLRAKSADGNVILNHSKLIPILSLLSSTGKRHSILNMNHLVYSEFQTTDSSILEMLPQLRILLSSPIFSVRNMCAKIMNNFFDVDNINFIDATSSENEIHGCLMTVKMCLKNRNTETSVHLIKIFEQVRDILKNKKLSYSVKLLCYEIECIYENKTRENKEFFVAINQSVCKNEPGYFNWQNSITEFIIKTCEEEELVKMFDQISQINNWILLDECAISALKDRISNESLLTEYISQVSLKHLFDIILNIQKCNNNLHSQVFELLYLIVCKLSEENSASLICHVNYLESIFKHDCIVLEKKYSQKYLLPLVCSLAVRKLKTSQELTDNVVKFSFICKTLANHKFFDSPSRFIAAVTIKHFTSFLKGNYLSSECKGNILTALIYLLQDEDSEVRYECAKNCNFSKESEQKNPYNVLLNILSETFILETFNRSCQKSIIFLKNFLEEISLHLNSSTTNIDALQNPFDSNCSNMYWEPVLLSEIIRKLVINIHR